MNNSAFPEGFVWGAASASFQIEGAASEDGRKESVWDMYCRKPGAIEDGETGAVACDHYHRFREDVALFKDIGLKAYRFSIAWSRVIPDGTGAVNAKGIAFYDQLVDELLAAGIDSWVTLFHWDYPMELFYRGGWLNPDSPKWFADYAETIVDALGDRVKNWMTFNEPQNVANLGHGSGTHAPGLQLPRKEIARVIHHILLAHGLSNKVLRNAGSDHKIGHAHSGWINIPADPNSAADIAATAKNMFDCSFWHPQKFSWWNDPLQKGYYPEEGLEELGNDAPGIGPDDMAIINQPLDFMGINYYGGTCIKAGQDGEPIDIEYPPGVDTVYPKWVVQPQGLYWGPSLLHERYGRPMAITENGLPNLDWVGTDGQVHDPQRIEWIRTHLNAIHQAIQDGADVMGYFYWSATDNLEWAEGFRRRYGLIHVDFNTQKRTLKDSARWYGDVISRNGMDL